MKEIYTSLNQLDNPGDTELSEFIVVVKNHRLVGGSEPEPSASHFISERRELGFSPRLGGGSFLTMLDRLGVSMEVFWSSDGTWTSDIEPAVKAEGIRAAFYDAFLLR